MTIPEIKIPVEIPSVVTDAVPHMFHPILVHFAIVLPLIVVILELVNVIMKRRSLTVSIYLLFILGMIVFAGAYLSGITDGSEAGPLLSAAGQEELKEHKNIGTLLLYLTLVPIIFKIFSVIVKKAWAKALYVLLLIAFAALTVYQAKDGGELVYKYGANVQAVQTAEDRIEELEDEIDALKSAPAKEASEPQSAVEEEPHEKVVVDLSGTAAPQEEAKAEAAVSEVHEAAVSEVHEAAAAAEETAEAVTQEVKASADEAQEAVAEEHKALEAAVNEHETPAAESEAAQEDEAPAHAEEAAETEHEASATEHEEAASEAHEAEADEAPAAH
jgi:uncharacterized membrane protein